ncbi:MAG: glycosyltransferase family 9 protein [Candidatus Binataceae bacterium]|nr:glycosyltransferase family 9 protein [Candidatus Binataceae bacterium]
MSSNPDYVNVGAGNKILIILMGSIGDVVRGLPLLGRVRRAAPHAHLAWAIEPKSLPVLQGHPWIDELIIYDRRAPWSFPSFLWRVRSRHFDLVLDLQRHLKSGIVSIASRAPNRLGFAQANTKELNHRFNNQWIAPQPPMRSKLMQYQAFGDALGLPPAPVEFGLEPSEPARIRARELMAKAKRPALGVILGSSWPSRIYFPDSIAAAIRILATSMNGAPALYPILIGSPEEVPLAAQVAAHLDGIDHLNLAGRTTLRDLVPIFEQCAAAFGPDSGPMHLAAAAGCPIVSLWGSTAPERSAPWGFAELAIKAEIPCHPCYRRECPIGRECMRRIEPSAVAAMVRHAIATRDRVGDHEIEALAGSAAK